MNNENHLEEIRFAVRNLKVLLNEHCGSVKQDAKQGIADQIVRLERSATGISAGTGDDKVAVEMDETDAEAHAMCEKAMNDFFHGLRDAGGDSSIDGNWRLSIACKAVIQYFSINAWYAPRREDVVRISLTIANYSALKESDINAALRLMMRGGKKKFLRARTEQGQKLVEMALSA